jgi:hypothetical protein
MTDSSFKTFASVLFLSIFGVAVLLPLQNAQARTIITPTVKVPPVHAIHTGAPVSSIPANQLHGSHYINNGALYKPKQISAKGNFGGTGSGSSSTSTGTACQVVQICVPNIFIGTQCSSETVCK